MIDFKILPVALVGSVLPLQSYASPAVNVAMQAAFPAGPYILELLYSIPYSTKYLASLINHSESAAGENSSCYFPLLDRIASGQFSALASESELYDKFVSIIKEDGHITTPESLSTFNLALSLRASAPRIEAHYQYYDTAIETTGIDTTCNAWIFSRGKQYCNPSMDSAVSESSSER